MAGNYQTLIVDATISRLIRFHRGYYVLVFDKRPCHSFFEFLSGATSSYNTTLDQSIRRYPFSIVVLSRILFQNSRIFALIKYAVSDNSYPFEIHFNARWLCNCFIQAILCAYQVRGGQNQHRFQVNGTQNVLIPLRCAVMWEFACYC